MDNIAYVALSRQQTLRREMDVIANNIANADTTGFKVESVMTATAPTAPAANTDAPNPVNFVRSAGVMRDTQQGALEQTHRPLDAAIEGEGFFQVELAPGRYGFTRDGGFQIDSDGRLITSAGRPVMDDASRPIELNPAGGPATIAEDGSLFQGGARVARIGVYRFSGAGQLEAIGGNLMRGPNGQTPQAVEDARVRGGMLESSTVQPITEITRMMEVQRAYERISRIVDSSQDLSRRAVERLGQFRS